MRQYKLPYTEVCSGKPWHAHKFTLMSKLLFLAWSLSLMTKQWEAFVNTYQNVSSHITIITVDYCITCIKHKMYHHIIKLSLKTIVLHVLYHNEYHIGVNKLRDEECLVE